MRKKSSKQPPDEEETARREQKRAERENKFEAISIIAEFLQGIFGLIADLMH
jgi:hypothetical protein